MHRALPATDEIASEKVVQQIDMRPGARAGAIFVGGFAVFIGCLMGVIALFSNITDTLPTGDQRLLTHAGLIAIGAVCALVGAVILYNGLVPYHQSHRRR